MKSMVFTLIEAMVAKR